MHYTIVAIGSRGDVQPYVALALGLKERGHEVTLIAHENFKVFVEEFGISFAAVKGHVESMLQSEEGMKVVRSGSLRTFTQYLQKVNRITSASMAIDLTGEFNNADVLIASLLATPWVEGLAEKFGKKWAIVQLNLPAIKTRVFPFVILDYFDFPSYNRLTYDLFEWAYWQANKKNVNDFRKRLQLPPLKRNILKIISEEKILNLHCFSPSLRARPDDWPSETDITGFLFVPPKKENEIPADLTDWIEKGENPVYIGFGSIPVPDPELFNLVLKELLSKTGDRFIYCYGWSPPMDLPKHPNLFTIKTVDHEWLFPRCRTAIIHGGVGTTAAVLRAGIPVIIISIIADQPWWGKIIEKKGVGFHIPFKKLTAQRLLTALRRTSLSEIKENAEKLAAQINAENGLSKTISRLENYFSMV